MLCPSCDTDNIPGVDRCEECGTNLSSLDVPGARAGFRGRLLTDEVGNFRISEAVVVSITETVQGAIERMREAQSGCVLVEESEELVGLFNERHLLTRVLRRNLVPATTPISSVMSLWPLKLSPEDPPAFAIHCMVTYGYRHLPVVSGRKILGYISVHNILAYLQQDVIAWGSKSESRG